MAYMNYLRLSDGSAMYYERSGKGEPLILLHGNGGSVDYFKNQINVLSQYFCVYALDLRGRGQSTDLADNISFTLMVEDLHEWLQHEHLQHIHLLGFSDGANLALLFAQKYPQYIKTLILNAANGSFNDLTLSAQWRFYIMNTLMKISSHFHKSAKKMHHYFQLAFANLNLQPQKLKQLSCPVLIIVGQFDIVKYSFSQKLAKLFKFSTLIVEPHVGHGFAVEAPNKYNQHILQFLLTYK